MRPLLDREERHAVRTDLISLEAGCLLAFSRLYGSDEDSRARNTPEARNAIAQALLGLLPIYTFDEERDEIFQIDYGDLRSGEFEQGGRRLAFPGSGREPITRLAVRAHALSEVIEKLRGWQPPREIMRPDPASSRPGQIET